MKHLHVLIVTLALSINAYALNNEPLNESLQVGTTETTTIGSTSSILPTIGNKNISVYLGQGIANDDNQKGITLGLEYGFMQHFLAGVNYINYSEKKAGAINDNGQAVRSKNAPTNEVASFYVGGKVVQHTHKKINLQAEVLAGGLQMVKLFNNSGSSEFDLFYGASATVNYNKDIGLRLSRRISDEIGTEDMLSVVGYY